MRNSILVNSLILISLAVSPSCVSGVADEGAPLGSTDEHILAPEQTAPLQSLDEQAAPYDDEGPLGANEEAAGAGLPCGLSTLQFEDHTVYWIRSCYQYKTHWQLIILDEGTVYDGKIHTIEALGTVSGSVRGKVLRVRRL